MAETSSPHISTVKHSVRIAILDDAEDCAKFQHETWISAYSHIFGRERIDTPENLQKRVDARKRIYGSSDEESPVFCVVELLDDELLSKGWPRICGLCDVSPIREYPTLPMLGRSNEEVNLTLEVRGMYIHPKMQRTGISLSHTISPQLYLSNLAFLLGAAQKAFAFAVRSAIDKFPHLTQRMIVLTLEVNTPGMCYIVA